MALTSPVDRFRSAAEATTPARLVVLLYERLHRDIVDAESALRAGDRYTAHRALLHAQEIVAELDGALDASIWADAPQMSNLYRFVTERLVEANTRQDPSVLRDCLTVVEPLVETWREAWQANAAGAVPARVVDADAGARMPLDVAG
jgi:flagellar protein FliS